MRKTHVLTAALLVAAGVGAYVAYSSITRSPEVAPQQAAPAAQPPAPAAPQAVLDVTVDGLADNTTWPGEPMLVEVTVFHPSFGAKESSPLIVDSGSVAIEVTDAADKPAAWPFQHTPAALTVDHTRAGRLTFALPAAATASFQTGSYRVRARTAQAASAPAFLDVVSRPPTLSADDERHQAERLAFFRLASGDAAGALRAADELVTRQARSADAHALHAAVLDTTDRKADALAAWQQALSLTPKESEVFQRLYTRARNDAFRAMVQ